MLSLIVVAITVLPFMISSLHMENMYTGNIGTTSVLVWMKERAMKDGEGSILVWAGEYYLLFLANATSRGNKDNEKEKEGRKG